jgi:hypothetical protein
MRNEAGERINSGKSGVRHGDLSPGWGANVGPRGDESAVAAGFRAVKRVNHIAARNASTAPPTRARAAPNKLAKSDEIKAARVCCRAFLFVSLKVATPHARDLI